MDAAGPRKRVDVRRQCTRGTAACLASFLNGADPPLITSAAWLRRRAMRLVRAAVEEAELVWSVRGSDGAQSDVPGADAGEGREVERGAAEVAAPSAAALSLARDAVEAALMELGLGRDDVLQAVTLPACVEVERRLPGAAHSPGS